MAARGVGDRRCGAGNAVYFTPALLCAVTSIRRNALHIRFRVSVDSLMLQSPLDSQILGLQG